MQAVLCLAIGSAALLDSVGLPTRHLRPTRLVAPQIRSVATSPTFNDGGEQVTTVRKQKTDRLHVRIDDEWYDLTNWRSAHPAGAHWIDAYKNADATEVRRRQRSRPPPAPLLSAAACLPPTGDVWVPLEQGDGDGAAPSEEQGASNRRAAACRFLVRLPRVSQEARGRRLVPGPLAR